MDNLIFYLQLKANSYKLKAKSMTIDEFKQCDLRVATVIAAERVQNSEKLLKLQVDVGDLGQRQILAGVGRVYEPESLVQKQIIIVANLDPRELMGEVSNGMVIAAHGAEGESVLIFPDRQVPAGSLLS